MALCAPWADTLSCSPCDDYSLDGTLVTENLLIASETLYELSAQQFPGECSIEGYRPCSSNTRTGGVPYRMTAFPPVSSSYYYDRFLGGCTCGSWDDCGCPPVSQVLLPFPYVTTVDEVKVDGDILPTTDYRLDANSLLVSTTTTRWPCCQNIRLADTEEGTWSVDLTYGRPPPALGIRAAQVLACELYMACDPEAFEGQCRLPNNAITIARQGVTVAKLIGELFTRPQRGPVRFGIPEIDMFLIAHNPYGLTTQSTFLSPDEPDLGRIVG